MKRRAILAVVVAAVAGSACQPVRVFRDALFGRERVVKEKPEKAPSSFAPYLLEAFPDARTVRVDSDSPRLSLAAESVLTRNDPHRRRGPPRFSPDGRLLAYEERDEEGERWIVIRKLNGSLIRRLPLAQTTESAPGDPSASRRNGRDQGSTWASAAISWAPSSDAFVFTRETAIGAYEAVLCDLAGEARKIVGPPAIDGSAVWSPAGDRVAYLPSTREGEIWAADAGSRKAEPITKADHPIESFAFSDDGRQVVFSAGDTERDIWIAELGSTPPVSRRITQWSFDDRRPSFSPGGKWIGFYSTFRPADLAPGWSLIIVAADGSSARSGAALMDRVLAKQVSSQFVTAPAWSPDAHWIAIVEPRTEDYRALVLVETQGRERHELNPDSITNEDVTVSPDGVLAYRARQEWGDHIVIGLTARGAMRTER